MDQNSKKRKTAPTNSNAQEELKTAKERKLDHTDTRVQEEPDPPAAKEEKQTMHAHHSTLRNGMACVWTNKNNPNKVSIWAMHLPEEGG